MSVISFVFYDFFEIIWICRAWCALRCPDAGRKKVCPGRGDCLAAYGAPSFHGEDPQRLVKEKVISSSKGPAGGFTINENTLRLPLIRLIDIIEGLQGLETCVLRVKACNEANPCPLHYQMEGLKHNLQNILNDTTIGDLLKEDKKDFINSISTGIDLEPVSGN